jgi:hypothetical protein
LQAGEQDDCLETIGELGCPHAPKIRDRRVDRRGPDEAVRVFVAVGEHVGFARIEVLGAAVEVLLERVGDVDTVERLQQRAIDAGDVHLLHEQVAVVLVPGPVADERVVAVDEGRAHLPQQVHVHVDHFGLSRLVLRPRASCRQRANGCHARLEELPSREHGHAFLGPVGAGRPDRDQNVNRSANWISRPGK